jgi:hypothetical protein
MIVRTVLSITGENCTVMNFAATHIVEGVGTRQEEVLMVAGVHSIGGEQVVAIHPHQTEDIFQRVQCPGIK